MKQSSYLMALLLLYAPVNCFVFFIGEEKPKHLMFVCTICYLGTELKRIKHENSRIKLSFKDREARCIKPVSIKNHGVSVRNTRKR